MCSQSLRIMLLTLLCCLTLALLTACGGNTELPAPEPAVEATPTPEPVPMEQVETPQPRILDFDKFMVESIEEVGADPSVFGKFFTTYLEENAQSIVKPIEFRQSNLGRLFDVQVPEDVQPAGQNRVLIIYYQQPNEEADIKEEGGVFLDCMALLPAEQIPNTLLAWDKIITLTAIPETQFTYENGMPGILWIIDVTCEDKTSGEKRTEYFNGGPPAYVAVYSPGDKYISGGFPLYQAVEYVLLLAANEPGAPLPEPVPPPPPMMISSPDETGGVPTRSTPIVIENSPEDAVCFALVMTDDDGFVYWMAANFTATELAANAAIDDAANMVQGINDFGRLGYSSPDPSNDELQSFNITVYALDAELPLSDGYSRDEFNAVFHEHMLDIAALNIMYFN